MNSADKKRPKYLILTCDSEALPGAAPDHHIDRLIWGRLPEAPYEAGIGKMMDIAEEFGARLVFFHEVLETLSYGDETARAARAILERGHDLQLHMHMEFLPREFWTRHGCQPPTWTMNLFDKEAAGHLMEYGVELFESMAGFKPLAYRAGAFRYNASILEALRACQIPLSFQYYPASALKPSFPYGFDAGILPVFKWSNGVLEVPLAIYEYPHPRNPPFRYRAFDLNQFTGGLEHAHSTMRGFWENGLEFTVCVMLLHSWSFLQKNEAGHFVWKGDSLVKLFREFLRTLPPDVQVITASELLQKSAQKDVLPSFEMPIQVAGTERIPLLRLSQSSRSTVQDAPKRAMPPSEPVQPASVIRIPEVKPKPQPEDETARAIRGHDEAMRLWRQRMVESYPYPALDDVHVVGARLLPSRSQLLDEMAKNGNVCELGVAGGDFSAQILARCSPATLHLVDAWDSERYSADQQKVKERFADAILKGRVVIHIGKSTDRLAEFPDHYFDWVYIDTVHDYRITSQELALSRQKVKTGGMIAGHDHTPGNIVSPVCYGVVQAVQEFCVKHGWRYRFLTCESHCYASFAIQAIDTHAT